MKLTLPAFVVVTIVPATAANNSRRHRRTLSATAKKPASVAGFLYLTINIPRLTPLFLPPAPLSRSPRSLHFTIQTPSSR
jgi:hypothetical protein